MELQELSLPLCTGLHVGPGRRGPARLGIVTCLWSNEVPSWVESGVETG